MGSSREINLEPEERSEQRRLPWGAPHVLRSTICDSSLREATGHRPKAHGHSIQGESWHWSVLCKTPEVQQVENGRQSCRISLPPPSSVVLITSYAVTEVLLPEEDLHASLLPLSETFHCFPLPRQSGPKPVAKHFSDPTCGLKSTPFSYILPHLIRLRCSLSLLHTRDSQAFMVGVDSSLSLEGPSPLMAANYNSSHPSRPLSNATSIAKPSMVSPVSRALPSFQDPWSASPSHYFILSRIPST